MPRSGYAILSPGLMLTGVLLAPAAVLAEATEDRVGGEIAVPQLSDERQPQIKHVEDGWYRDQRGRVIIVRDDGTRYVLPESCVDRIEAQSETPWVDWGHAVISHGLCWPTRWVDSFFGYPEGIPGEVPGTFVSLESAQRWRDDDEHQTDLGVDVRVNLPRLERRLSLIVTNRDEDTDERRGRDLVENEADAEEGDTAFRTGLRWAAATTDAMNLDLDAGVRSGLTPYAQIRYRQHWAPGEHWHIQFDEMVRWIDARGYESRTRLDFDRELGETNALRFASYAFWSEENIEDNRGWLLRQSASIYTRVSSRTGIRSLAQVEGYTRPHRHVDNYLLSLRYRQNIWRPWFFYEIEPLVVWPEWNEYQSLTGLWIRLELRLGRYNN